mmetsp:Transcript_3800/g.6587  ORF Transcript_3800/g.6587 Transcript_3800/m.6587 type:complete len:203 (+) Transcript_3800:333-941(+)
MKMAMVTVVIVHVISTTVSMPVSHPTPIIRTNILVRCIDSARQIPKMMRTICRKRSAPEATLSCRRPSPSAVPSSKLTRPIVLSVPNTDMNGTIQIMTESTISSRTGTHFDISSITAMMPKNNRPGQLATIFSIVSPIDNKSGLAFSMIPTRNRVRKGATPSFPATTSDTAALCRPSKNVMAVTSQDTEKNRFSIALLIDCF